MSEVPFVHNYIYKKMTVYSNTATLSCRISVPIPWEKSVKTKGHSENYWPVIKTKTVPV